MWNAFFLPDLLDMGLAVAMLQPPLGGERSFCYSFDGMMHKELAPVIANGGAIDHDFVQAIFGCTARDIRNSLQLLSHEHGLSDTRVALAGISLGALQCGYSFICDGIGTRYLAAIGHCDSQNFARSYTPFGLGYLSSSSIGKLLQETLRMVGNDQLAAIVPLLRLIHHLAQDTPAARALNPMSYVERVGAERRASFLYGLRDSMVDGEHVRQCCRQLPNARSYAVAGMGHGGRDFDSHIRYFYTTQLGDWAW